MEFTFLTEEQRVPPVRGIILTANKKRQTFDLIDLQRWARIGSEGFKVLKVDLLLDESRVADLPELVSHARGLGLQVSLRVDGSFPPGSLDLAKLGLLDLFVAPAKLDAAFDAWLAAGAAAGLPMRVQVQPPFPEDLEALAARLAQSNVAVVNVALHDPFVPEPPCSARAETTVKQMNGLVSLLAARDVEVNLLRLPFCFVDAANLPYAENDPQFFQDHQQYHHQAYTFAANLYRCGPKAAARAITIPLGRGKSSTWYTDARLLPWITESPWLHTRLLIYRKLTRVLRKFGLAERPIEGSQTAYERELAKVRAKEARACGPVCSQCSLRHICYKLTPQVRALLPGMQAIPQPGEQVLSPLHFAHGQKKYYDAIDAARVRPDEIVARMAEDARQIVANTMPTREVDSDNYEIEDQWTHHMPGGNRWYSFVNGEKLSTPLTRTAAPLTVSVMLGGGIAELAGFSFGRNSKILCRMESYIHQLVLHVDSLGRYVLLRDGKPVRPVEFEGLQMVPNRLPGVLEPRLSLWNIDGAIVTQTVLVWEGNPAAAAQLARVKYSVFIVTSRYARRLQAVLLSLANQRGFDLSKLEVVIGYVPGIDATDDVIDSMEMAYPDLRIVRAPFQDSYAKSKGFLINESAKLASGDWVILLDSDTLVGPDMFAAMERVEQTCVFMAPDGRKMLPPQVTAEVLLGRVNPWDQWQYLLDGPGEFRAREANGIPIGFFQAVRKSCLDKVQYMELDHFEGADWWFGYTIRYECGQELRLTGMPVVHLDHGGSQWYGTQKHR